MPEASSLNRHKLGEIGLRLETLNPSTLNPERNHPKPCVIKGSK